MKIITKNELSANYKIKVTMRTHVLHVSCETL